MNAFGRVGELNDGSRGPPEGRPGKSARGRLAMFGTTDTGGEARKELLLGN